MMPMNKGKQINKQAREQHMWGCGCRGLYAVMQSAESDMQCVRVCGGALEMVRGAQSLVHEAVL